MDKQVVRDGPFKQFIPDGIRVGDTIYLSGQVSLDDSGNVVGAGDLPAQVRQAYTHVKATLEKLGASMDNVVDEMWLVTDVAGAMANMDKVWPARIEAYGGDPAVAQTMVQIGGLVLPGLMIEIKITARV